MEGPLEYLERRGPSRLARILHEAFYYERRKHGIFGSIFRIRTRMYSSTIRPRIRKINSALGARILRTSAALATKFRAICGLVFLGEFAFQVSLEQ